MERDLLFLKFISTTENYSDTLTNNLGCTLYYKYFDYIVGRIQPTYVDNYLSLYSRSYSYFFLLTDEYYIYFCASYMGDIGTASVHLYYVYLYITS